MMSSFNNQLNLPPQNQMIHNSHIRQEKLITGIRRGSPSHHHHRHQQVIMTSGSNIHCPPSPPLPPPPPQTSNNSQNIPVENLRPTHSSLSHHHQRIHPHDQNIVAAHSHDLRTSSPEYCLEARGLESPDITTRLSSHSLHSHHSRHSVTGHRTTMLHRHGSSREIGVRSVCYCLAFFA